MQDRIKDLLTDLKARLATTYGSRLKAVYLYGSYARGDQESESDIDILIILDRVDHYSLEIDHTGELVSELSLRSGISVSRLFVSEDDWQHRDTPFLANAREEAIRA